MPDNDDIGTTPLLLCGTCTIYMYRYGVVAALLVAAAVNLLRAGFFYTLAYQL
jgi:hypothetical protein